MSERQTSILDAGWMMLAAAREIERNDITGVADMQEDLRAMGMWVAKGCRGAPPQLSETFWGMRDEIERQLVERGSDAR